MFKIRINLSTIIVEIKVEGRSTVKVETNVRSILYRTSIRAIRIRSVLYIFLNVELVS